MCQPGLAEGKFARGGNIVRDAIILQQQQYGFHRSQILPGEAPAITGHGGGDILTILQKEFYVKDTGILALD